MAEATDTRWRKLLQKSRRDSLGGSTRKLPPMELFSGCWRPRAVAVGVAAAERFIGDFLGLLLGFLSGLGDGRALIRAGLGCDAGIGAVSAVRAQCTQSWDDCVPIGMCSIGITAVSQDYPGII